MLKKRARSARKAGRRKFPVFPPFTYELDDGQGNNSSANAYVTVASVNDARIETTGDPNMYADEGELIDVKFDTPDATYLGNVTWSATGLPAGLTIEASGQAAGHIHGRPLYSDAQTNGGEWDVALTANYPGGDTDTVEFTWHVADVNRLPWIDDQASQSGDNLNLNFYAHDNINPPSTWSYSFSGLPADMASPAEPSGLPGEYDVTITFTAGEATDTRTFHWSITPAAVPIPVGQTPAPGVAAFGLNDTFVHQDDVGLVGVGMPMALKFFLTEYDYDIIANNNIYIKLEVVTHNAGLSQDPDDTVGSDSLILGEVGGASPSEGNGEV